VGRARRPYPRQAEDRSSPPPGRSGHVHGRRDTERIAAKPSLRWLPEAWCHFHRRRVLQRDGRRPDRRGRSQTRARRDEGRLEQGRTVRASPGCERLSGCSSQSAASISAIAMPKVILATTRQRGTCSRCCRAACNSSTSARWRSAVGVTGSVIRLERPAGRRVAPGELAPRTLAPPPSSRKANRKGEAGGVRVMAG